MSRRSPSECSNHELQVVWDFEWDFDHSESDIAPLRCSIDRLCPECGEWIVVTDTGNLHCTDDFRTGIFNENELEDLGLLQLKESKKYLKRARAQLKADPPCSPDVVLDRECWLK